MELKPTTDDDSSLTPDDSASPHVDTPLVSVDDVDTPLVSVVENALEKIPKKKRKPRKCMSDARKKALKNGREKAKLNQQRRMLKERETRMKKEGVLDAEEDSSSSSDVEEPPQIIYKKKKKKKPKKPPTIIYYSSDDEDFANDGLSLTHNNVVVNPPSAPLEQPHDSWLVFR